MGQRLTITESERQRIQGLYEQKKPLNPTMINNPGKSPVPAKPKNVLPSGYQPIPLVKIKIGNSLTELNAIKKSHVGAHFYGKLRDLPDAIEVYFECGKNKVHMGYFESGLNPHLISAEGLKLLNNMAGCNSYVKNQDTTSSDMA